MKENKLEKIHPSYKELYGIELASKVADYIEVYGEIIPNKHRDYCGTCYFYYEGIYGFSQVYDGYPCVSVPIKKFTDKQKFISWLAGKSDWNMSGYDPNDLEIYEKDTFYQGNQRCLKANLEFIINKKTKL